MGEVFRGWHVGVGGFERPVAIKRIPGSRHSAAGAWRSPPSGFRGTQHDDDLIARFGIGFLTVFLVSDDITVLTRSTSSEMGFEAIILFGVELASRNEDADILAATSREFALLDITSIGIKWLPLLMMDLRGDSGVPRASLTAMGVYGSEASIVQFNAQISSLSHRSGGSGFDLIMNIGPHYRDGHRLQPLRAAHETSHNFRLYWSPTLRESPRDVLVRGGIPSYVIDRMGPLMQITVFPSES